MREYIGWESWKTKHGYGRRWAVEGFFSAVKRCFGESVRASSPDKMIREVKRKFLFYNLLLSL